MRHHLAVAALAMTAAACGAPAVQRTAAPAAAPVALDAFAPAQPERRAVPVRTEATHDHSTHDHATHTHAAPAAKKKVEPPPFDTGGVTSPRKTPRVVTSGRWRTPEAAMRYLTRAYNANDADLLKKVTTPSARRDLLEMRKTFADLRLTNCVDSQWGSYICHFTHAIKGSTQRGTTELQVSPAVKQGWYASGFLGCG